MECFEEVDRVSLTRGSKRLSTLEMALAVIVGNQRSQSKGAPGATRGLETTEHPLEVRDLRQALAATRESLSAALAQNQALEFQLLQSEELFRNRAAELSRYQAELESANDRLRNLAVTDDLTGLRNRRAFEERLTFEFSMARRKQRELSVVLIDADDFKMVNDQLGHKVGDSVLQQLAKVLGETVRLTDLAVRYGGEEFAVLLPESDERAALLWCRRMRNALKAAQWEHHSVTVSMGVARMTVDCVDGNHLVALADQALYRAKAQGKNCFVGSGEVQVELV